ncbi:MAG: hypothetical protein AAGK97_17120, partial [Bacteroidota bacterium]
MLSIIYPISFIVSLSGLIFWFYFKGNKSKSRLMSTLFLGGFFAYLFSLAFADGQLTSKLLILARDMFIMGIVSQFFHLLVKNKILFFGVYLGVLALFKFVFYKKMEASYLQMAIDKMEISQVPDAKIANNLSDQFELLVDLKNSKAKKKIDKLANKYDLEVEYAFYLEDEKSSNLDDYLAIGIPDHQEANLDEIIHAIQKTGAIEYYEGNEAVSLDDP